MNSSRVDISFRTSGFLDTLEEISDTLGLEPRYQRRKGDAIFDAAGVRVGEQRHSYWLHRLSLLPDETVASAIDRMVMILEGKREYLQKLASQGASFNFFLGYEADKHAGDSFPAHLLWRIGRLSISLDIEFYYRPADSSGTRQ